MRKIVAPVQVSVDGVMQAPGGPDEDPTGGFRLGGWVAPYYDDAVGEALVDIMGRPFDLLLGRKTYEIFAAYWPYRETAPEEEFGGVARSFGDATKHVASRSQPQLPWRNSRWLGADAVAAVRELKAGDGPELHIWGSSNFVQSLLAADLIDEVRLLTYPLVLGRGKRFFGEDAPPMALKLTTTRTSPSGVIITTYQRDGEVKTGSFGDDEPSAAELERRRHLT